MASSSYTAVDQAADLGIHRVHSLVLGDPRKEARIAARYSPPQLKRPILGKGDVRTEEHQCNRERRRELETIARRNNLKTDNTGVHDENSLTNKIAAWGALKVDNAIARPDGLGTGNAHRGGPNYRPIASFGQPRRTLSIRPIRPNGPGSSTFAGRSQSLPPAAGSAAAAWQAAALGKQFQAFSLGGNSSISIRRVPARSPIRTPARKSVVGSPRIKPSLHPVEPLVQHAIGLLKSAEKTQENVGSTYADQMARVKSKISSDHAPPKPDGVVSPKTSPAKSAVPPSQTLGDSRWSTKSPSARPATQAIEGSRWSGKLATASDPYFQNPPMSPTTSPQLSQPLVSLAPPLDAPNVPISVQGSPESSLPTDTAPSTPASISTSTALEIEEYLDLLEAEDEEENRYNADPDRRKRDLELNERVNRAIAEAEEAVLAREILSPRAEPRKTVQFSAENQIRVFEEEYNRVGDDVGDSEIMTRIIYLWDTFRDFATARCVTGFEEFVQEPRHMMKFKPSVADKKIGTEKLEETVQVEKKGEKKDEIVEIAPVNGPKVESSPSSTRDVATPVINPTPPPALTPMAAVICPPQTATIIPISAPAPKPDASSLENPSSPPLQSIDNLLIPVATPQSTTTLFPVETSHNIQPTPHVPKSSPAQIREIKVTTSITPESEPRNNPSPAPASALKDVEPADVESTWDMPTTPLVRIDMERTETERDIANDPFLAGLSSSKKVDVKSGVNDKVVVVDEPKRAEISEDTKTSAPKYDSIVAPVEKVVHATSAQVESQVTSPTSMLGSFTFAAMAGPIPSLARPMIASPPQLSSIPRSGIPLPVPIPPTPRPETKSPARTEIKPILVATPVILLKPMSTKPIVAPKPANLVSTPKTKPALSPIVGGLIDPFLVSLEPTAKKETPPARPNTPSASTDSADSTPKKSNSPSTSTGHRISTETVLETSLSESAPPSPTSLSSSWTLVEKGKREIATKDISPIGPPSKRTPLPVRRTWIGADTVPLVPRTPAPEAPSMTPATKPPSEPAASTEKPVNPMQGRKLFTFELKVGSSILSTPVHELDDPGLIAEQFAKQHDLETRLPKGTVENIICYFETQFAERKAEREKRRAERRERMKSALTGEQQKM